MPNPNMRILNINQWDLYTTDQTSQALKWPGSHTKHRWKTKSWRSNYGVSSGFGTFVIDATNNKIYFDEGGGSLIATLTIGVYNADTLAVEIETQLEASGTHSYTVIYNGVDLKFEITDDTGTVILELATTTNALWLTIGFTTGIDTAAAASHIADSIRIHTSEIIKIDSGSGNTIDFMAAWIIHHNISATGIVNFEASDDDFSTTPVSVTMTPGDDLFVYVFSVLTQYRYVRYVVIDIDNADGYIELGRCWVADWFEPEKPFNNKRPFSDQDPSLVNLSEGRQVSAIQRDGYRQDDFTFDMVTASDFDEFRAISKRNGNHREMMILIKKTSMVATFAEPEKYSRYCRIAKPLTWRKVGGLIYGLKMKIVDEN